ncbi:hypothetical protein JZ751_021958 [Albula glossodonta]|uniref:Uncharacterized protein n=1 Tax=Albula glossodonta TaxID=121402 RepID=A0A8T2MQZ3_9TELE|nr:hypothetical protein JZ751_021958 [Albula glossodonta]
MESAQGITPSLRLRREAFSVQRPLPIPLSHEWRVREQTRRSETPQSDRTEERDRASQPALTPHPHPHTHARPVSRLASFEKRPQTPRPREAAPALHSKDNKNKPKAHMKRRLKASPTSSPGSPQYNTEARSSLRWKGIDIHLQHEFKAKDTSEALQERACSGSTVSTQDFPPVCAPRDRQGGKNDYARRIQTAVHTLGLVLQQHNDKFQLFAPGDTGDNLKPDLTERTIIITTSDVMQIRQRAALRLARPSARGSSESSSSVYLKLLKCTSSSWETEKEVHPAQRDRNKPDSGRPELPRSNATLRLEVAIWWHSIGNVWTPLRLGSAQTAPRTKALNPHCDLPNCPF